MSHLFCKNETGIPPSFNSPQDQQIRIGRRNAWHIFAIGIAYLCLAGCTKKIAPNEDRRAVTAEVVAAAQKITNNKSQVVIRPQLQTSRHGGAISVDNIYVSLASPAQEAPFDQALAAIGRRHGLTITGTTAAAGVSRFAFSFDGNLTHTIHVVTSLSAKAHPPGQKNRDKSGAARLAIIIDDMGYDRAAADAVIGLPFPLTISVLPHLPISAEVAEEAYKRGDQILLHLPMESDVETAKSEEVELRVGMNASQVLSAVSGMLDTVPHAVGVNNHQGSRATSNTALMQALMPFLRERKLFFIDSRTDVKTVAYNTAKRDGVRAASRKVFLDDTAAQAAIIAQLDLAARDATRDGFTIAIGHPRPATIAALAEEVPRLEARGIQLVFASDVVQ